MAFCELRRLTSTFVAFLAEFEGYVPVTNHVLDLVPTQERRHEDEVEEEEWPVDGNIG